MNGNDLVGGTLYVDSNGVEVVGLFDEDLDLAGCVGPRHSLAGVL